MPGTVCNPKSPGPEDHRNPDQVPRIGLLLGDVQGSGHVVHRDGVHRDDATWLPDQERVSGVQDGLTVEERPDPHRGGLEAELGHRKGQVVPHPKGHAPFQHPGNLS